MYHFMRRRGAVERPVTYAERAPFKSLCSPSGRGRLRWGRLIVLVHVLICATAPAQALDIRRDYGGKNWDYLVRVLSAGNERIRILGVCESACTMYLGAENVCVMPNARLGFHASYDPATGQISRNGAEMVAHFLPAVLREHYLQDWSRTKRVTRLTGVQLAAMDPAVRLCA